MLLGHPNARSKTANAVIASVEPDPTSSNPQEPVEIGRLTYAELYTEVNKAAHALLKLGVKPGESVVTFAANSCEMVIVFLATVAGAYGLLFILSRESSLHVFRPTAVGAIFSSTPAEFGAHAVIDRYSLIKPKVLFTIDQYRYGGKTHTVVERARQVVDMLTKIGGLEHVIVIGHLALDRKPVREALRGYAPGVSVRSWQDFVTGTFPNEIPFHRGDFNDTMWIVFSSGTTGKPKAIYGPAGGIILMRRVTFKVRSDNNPPCLTWLTCNLATHEFRSSRLEPPIYYSKPLSV